jgi:hypothetical protein
MANTETSAYLLLVRDTTPEVYDAMNAAQKRSALDRWNGWVNGMRSCGKLRDGRPLENSRRVVSGAGGQHVMDGPYAEAKELVGGYFLFEDITLDEVTALARECPLLPYGMSVEIGEVAPACHLARAIGWETMTGPAAS